MEKGEEEEVRLFRRQGLGERGRQAQIYHRLLLLLQEHPKDGRLHLLRHQQLGPNHGNTGSQRPFCCPPSAGFRLILAE